MTPLEELKSWLTKPRRITITTHQKPDGDAIGSSLGLYHFLTGQGHKVKVVVPTDYPENLKWMPGNDTILIGPNDTEGANWDFLGADIIFCLDLNALNRLSEFEDVVRSSEARKVMIDHHLEPEGFDELRFWEPEASSTAELVFKLIDDWGAKDQITPQLATALYAGIMTDTGSFRFNTTKPLVHRIVAELIEYGAEPYHTYEQIFANSTENRLRFLGHCFSNCLHVYPELKTAYIAVPKEMFKSFNVKSGETEGLVNFALEMKGIVLGILITENDEMIKLSFRSRGNFAANEFAKHFEGGGHFNAAGGRSRMNMDETEKKLVSLLEQFKVELHNA